MEMVGSRLAEFDDGRRSGTPLARPRMGTADRPESGCFPVGDARGTRRKHCRLGRHTVPSSRGPISLNGFSDHLLTGGPYCVTHCFYNVSKASKSCIGSGWLVGSKDLRSPRLVAWGSGA